MIYRNIFAAISIVGLTALPQVSMALELTASKNHIGLVVLELHNDGDQPELVYTDYLKGQYLKGESGEFAGIVRFTAPHPHFTEDQYSKLYKGTVLEPGEKVYLKRAGIQVASDWFFFSTGLNPGDKVKFEYSVSEPLNAALVSTVDSYAVYRPVLASDDKYQAEVVLK